MTPTEREELLGHPKEHILTQAELFRHGLKMWQEAYRQEVGEERFQELLKIMRGED